MPFPYYWNVYETSLDGKTLVLEAKTHTPIGGWWQGTYFITDSGILGGPAYTWVRPDGTITTVNPLKDCQRLYDKNTGGYFSGSSSYKQSSNGNVVVGAYCPNGDMSLFWANPNGTVFTPLLNLHGLSASDTTGNLGWAPPDFAWSPDDKFIAFNLTSNGKTSMYLVNVIEALKDPSIIPVQVSKGSGTESNLPVWQPQP